MGITMIITDVLTVVVSALYLQSSIGFIQCATANKKSHMRDAVVQQHFIEHFIACSTGMAGAFVTLFSSIAHLVEQDIIEGSIGTLRNIEYCQDVGIVVVLLSGIMFMVHMKHEETKGHPFYCREYHEKP